jgi:hypothetical protein
MFLAAAMLVPACGRAEPTLESSARRLKLMDNPYSYCVVEKSTGKVLVCESSTVVAVGTKPYPLLELRKITRDSNKIQAEVLIENEGRDPLVAGTPDHVLLTFAFVKPEVLQVQITYEPATEISAEFKDQAEHVTALLSSAPDAASWDGEGKSANPSSKIVCHGSLVRLANRKHPLRQSLFRDKGVTSYFPWMRLMNN